MIKDVLERCDHTVLDPCATEDDVKKAIDTAIKYRAASVCVAPSFVSFAAGYAEGRIKISTVVGFPLGFSTTSVKCFEAREAAVNGADEIDMVINLGYVKEKRWREISDEIESVKLSSGRVLKVIIETCLLTEEEKIKLCDVVSHTDADFLKTSTGFSTGGATEDDVKLLYENLVDGTKLKAAGGIATIEAAEKLVELGADRLGSSRLLKLAEEMGV